MSVKTSRTAALIRAALVGVTASSLVAGVWGVSPALAAPGRGIVAPDPAALPTPLPDPFYAKPANLDKTHNGDILAVRGRPTPAGFFDIRTYQIKFRSSDSLGNPIAAITTVMVPNRHALNGPLLSFQHVINATGLECAPSQALWTSDPNLQIREAPGLNVALQRGWTVAIPDHLGPRSAYGAAKLGGQITLDGIRAVRHFKPAGVAHSRIGLAGYSGGGMATAWAAALQPTYAKDLKLAGVAYGGVPMDLIKMAEGLGYDRPHPAFGLAFAAAIGLSREYPATLPMRAHLTGLGHTMYREMRNACTNDILRIGAMHDAKQVATGGRQLFDDKAGRRVVEENSLVYYRGVPKTPVFEWHSPTDVLIPVASIDATNHRYCRAGTPLVSLLTPSPDHMSAAVIGILPAFAFLQDRFDGKPPPSNCR
ncbi:lipase [Gordonia sp. X0973]|uniref:lipase family protein n=1 Tax=Gordonia sp. X0973 TaxID=2742602 RepID=UPI000F531AB3|nr:lipase family protein [Gordonia sp. X0973]QKT08638.1 lipase [Gordonia sp. X0973]